MPEALEKWPLELMEELLPRHVEIIKRIDEEFVASVKAAYPKATEEEMAAKLGHRILENYVTPGGCRLEPRGRRQGQGCRQARRQGRRRGGGGGGGGG